MKQAHKTVFALFAAAILALGMVLAQEDDEAAIEALGDQWVESYNAGNAEAVAELYTEDAIFFNAVGQVFEGRQAILANLQDEIEAGPAEVSIETIETVVTNDTAYDLGTYTVTGDEGEILAEGHYLVILNRVDGQWMIHRHIDNMILPEPETNDMGGSN